MLSPERVVGKALAYPKGFRSLSVTGEEKDEEDEEEQKHTSVVSNASDLALVSRLKACVAHQNSEKACEIYNHIPQNGVFERKPYVGKDRVNVYTKGGALTFAQKVFDELPIRDVVSWTVLISGHTQHGLGERALFLYEQMQAEGVTPDAVTFACAFKACAIIEEGTKGKEIHSEAVKRGHLEVDYLLGNALLDMYVKCHAVEDAQNVFNLLPFRSIVSWTTLIQGYCMEGHGKEALHCYELMQWEGLSPNMLTFAFVLKACGNIRSAERGEQVHAEIVKMGLFDGNLMLGNALVDMYAKSCALENAQRVFIELVRRDEVSWTALISGYCEHGLAKEALLYFDHIQRENYPLDTYTLSCLLQVCCSDGTVDKGERIHAYILKEGSVIVNGNLLINMYGRCGALARAQVVFEELPDFDVGSWTSLISGYVQHGFAKEALQSFEKMQQEDLFLDDLTFSCALKAYGSMAEAKKGIDLHSEIARKGLHGKNTVVGNALVDFYAKCGALAKAQEVFDELIFRDVVSWNTLITAYAHNGYGDVAIKCSEKMLQEGLHPDEVTFSCLVKACSSVGAAEKGKEIHSEIARKGLLKKNVLLGNALVDMYSRCGALQMAEEVFNGLSEKGVVAWTSLMEGYCESMRSEQAISLFEKMQSMGYSPNSVTYLPVLRACGNLGAKDKGKELHDKIVQEGLLAENCALGAALVDMYAKCGIIERAQQVFDELTSQNVVSWTALIAGYGQVGKHKTVLALFERMVRNSVAPSSVTFIVLLNSCSHLGLVYEGEKHFKSMETIYGIIPSSEHQTCMVDLFGRAGLFDKAMTVIKEMQVDCLPAWFTLLGACNKWGEVKLGRFAFEQVVKLDKEFSLAYTCMSSIYSRAGMEEDALKIEALRTRCQQC